LGADTPDAFNGAARGSTAVTTGQDPGRPAVRAGPDVMCCLRCQTEIVPKEAILVVDDHDGFRRLARQMLEAAGFTVTEAANGAEAAETARLIRPRLVLLDIQLPDHDGFEVARRLAAQPHRPVIVLTSTRDASDYGGLIAASPAAGFLPKDQLSGVALRAFLGASPS
jgi:CheY-like chemotaxis protein